MNPVGLAQKARATRRALRNAPVPNSWVREAVKTRVGVDPEVDLVTVDDLLARSSSVAKFPRVVTA